MKNRSVQGDTDTESDKEQDFEDSSECYNSMTLELIKERNLI